MKPARPPLTRGEKRSEFAKGFFGQLLLLIAVAVVVWVVAVIALFLSPEIAAQWSSKLAGMAAGVFGLLNVVLVIGLAFRRPWVALGSVTFWAVAFALTIIAGVLWNVACYVVSQL